MEINYWIAFLVVFILVAVKLVKSAKDFSWNNSEDVGYLVFGFPIMAGLFACLLLNCFSSAVFEIRDNKKHSENDYLFYYKDYNDEYHIVVPFTNYLSNASSREVKLSKVGYGKNKNDKFNDIYFAVGVFKSIDRKPDYYFTDPPRFVKAKSSGAIRGIINYK